MPLAVFNATLTTGSLPAVRDVQGDYEAVQL